MTCDHILLVEDDPDVSGTLKEILEMEGFTVATAANGQEALQWLEGSQSCLILLDLMMPVMNGWQFLETLKSSHQNIFAAVPIVVVSAAADLTTVQEQYNCRTINKPCSIDALLALAHEYCHAA